MIVAHQNLNCSPDLTMPLSGMVCYDHPTKFEVHISTQYEDMKGDTKCGKCGGFGY